MKWYLQPTVIAMSLEPPIKLAKKEDLIFGNKKLYAEIFSLQKKLIHRISSVKPIIIMLKVS